MAGNPDGFLEAIFVLLPPKCQVPRERLTEPLHVPLFSKPLRPPLLHSPILTNPDKLFWKEKCKIFQYSAVHLWYRTLSYKAGKAICIVRHKVTSPIGDCSMYLQQSQYTPWWSLPLFSFSFQTFVAIFISFQATNTQMPACFIFKPSCLQSISLVLFISLVVFLPVCMFTPYLPNTCGPVQQDFAHSHIYFIHLTNVKVNFYVRSFILSV